MIKRIAAILLAASLTLGLAACGDSDSSSKAEGGNAAVSSSDNSSAGSNNAASKDDGNASESKDEPASQEDASSEEKPQTVPASNKVYYDFDFMLPDGWTFTPDTFSLTGEEDPSGFTLTTDTVKMYITMKNSVACENAYNAKSDSDAVIPPTKSGEIEWKGFSYSDKTGFEVYGDAKANYVYVTCTGLAFDSPEANTVLGTMKQWEPTKLV